MLGSKGAELEFSHVRLIDAEEENADEGENNNGEEGETDIDDGPPVGTPILVDKIESHEDGPQPMHSNVDIEVGRRRPSCRNPYTPFLDVDEFEFAFRLIKHGISKKAVDDIMSLRTIRSRLPNGHFKSAHTLAKKVENIEPDGLGKQWVMSTIDYDAGGSETPYYWRDPVNVVRDLLQNPAYQNDLIYTPSKLRGKFGERIYGKLDTGDWWWKLQVRTTAVRAIPDFSY